MNERHGALAQPARPGLRFCYARWPQPAATGPSSKTTLGRLVTSQHSALPLDQGTGVRPSGSLPSDLNKLEDSLVTGNLQKRKRGRYQICDIQWCGDF